MPALLCGMKVITSPYLEQDGEPYEVVRTWRQRLFSLPWRPLLRSYMVTPKIPYQGFYNVGNNTVVMHPDMLKKLERELPEMTGRFC